MNKHKPDERRENVGKIRNHIENTRENIELAEEVIACTSNSVAKQQLKAKNARRAEAISGMMHEMQEEKAHLRHNQ